MTKTQLKETIRNLKKDTVLLIEENLHPRCNDLMQMVMKEDLPEILKFLQQVYRVFDFELPDKDNSYTRGYNDGIKQIESEIFDAE